MLVGVVYHCEQTTGRLDDALANANANPNRYYLHRGDPLPLDQDFDRVVVLGGEMGAYEDSHHSWMAPAKRWLADLVSNGVPVLGICLGSQLLASALGGAAFPGPQPEAGVVPLTLTEAGRSEAALVAAGPKVLALHQDTFRLPPGATLLATSDAYPQAFRLGSALALQFHPDADLDLAARWGKEEWSMLARAGIDYDSYRRHLEEADEQLDAGSRRLFATWLEGG